MHQIASDDDLRLERVRDRIALSTSMATRPRKALIIGGGPVGALTALSLHKRGWQVEVWEGRDGESGGRGVASLTDGVR